MTKYMINQFTIVSTLLRPYSEKRSYVFTGKKFIFRKFPKDTNLHLLTLFRVPEFLDASNNST